MKWGTFFLFMLFTQGSFAQKDFELQNNLEILFKKKLENSEPFVQENYNALTMNSKSKLGFVIYDLVEIDTLLKLKSEIINTNKEISEINIQNFIVGPSFGLIKSTFGKRNEFSLIFENRLDAKEVHILGNKNKIRSVISLSIKGTEIFKNRLVDSEFSDNLIIPTKKSEFEFNKKFFHKGIIYYGKGTILSDYFFCKDNNMIYKLRLKIRLIFRFTF